MSFNARHICELKLNFVYEFMSERKLRCLNKTSYAGALQTTQSQTLIIIKDTYASPIFHLFAYMHFAVSKCPFS